MASSSATLADVVGALAEANEELVAAATAGDAERMSELMRHVAALEKQRNRLIRAAGAAPAAPYETAVPLRDQVVQTLRLGGRPMSTRLLADLARARFDYTIATPKLSSLRRDEANSWSQAHSGRGRTTWRDVYVVPALTYDRFAPVRGTLALSVWPLADRLIAPASPRVDMLKITSSIARECADAPDGAPWLPQLRRLLWRLARTVPGLKVAGADDPAAVQEAVGAELQILEGPDAQERELAAARHDAMDEFTAMFGTTTTVHVRPTARGA
jgi:hypothetical protein